MPDFSVPCQPLMEVHIYHAVGILTSNTLYLIHFMTCTFSVLKPNEVSSISPVSSQCTVTLSLKITF